MRSIPRWGRHVVAPAAAAVYLVFWIAQSWGRGGVFENTVVFGLFALAIGLAYWMPVTSLALTLITPVLQLIGLIAPPSDTTWPSYGAVGFVMFFVALRPSPWLRFGGLAVAAAVAAMGAWLMAVPTLARPEVWGSWVGSNGGLSLQLSLLTASLFGVYAGAWAAGFAFASFRRVRTVNLALVETESRAEEADFELRLALDRARISRDVHDALAHSLAVVVSQAQGAIALRAVRPEVADESLQTIAEVGRTALLDVRRLVERITQDDDVTAPRQTLADVDTLIASMRDLGMEVTVTRLRPEPAPPEPIALAPSQELAVYRIVQESLTNALKHAGTPSVVGVVMAWTTEGFSVTITSSGRGDPLVAARRGPERGAGIRGMTERARLAGGTLTAEPSDDGASFVVRLFVPGGPVSAATASIPLMTSAGLRPARPRPAVTVEPEPFGHPRAPLPRPSAPRAVEVPVSAAAPGVAAGPGAAASPSVTAAPGVTASPGATASHRPTEENRA
ncbi:sensor histidine kinase [Frigoribacterium sp. 2-23]|uniref:sensor histidine kinase n=1 Tax=Frigoribacterium sp. 2-23 TaxID=3415006 RepID=UPI003C701702